LAAVFSTSPDIPDPIKRAVYERDGGRCAFISDDGRRCCETGGLEFDHIDGFAQTHVHDVDRIRLLCRAHNQHAADQLYGRVFMERLRESRKEAKAAAHPPAAITRESPTCPGASCQQVLF
jgi:5-methylcytosine-specific restriction endonuclease McrA